jgi:probable HAF family extracellular repeat protein
MRRSLWVLAAAVLVALLVAVARAGGGEQAGRWRLVDLGTLGGTWSSAAAINARGQIVGTSSPEPGHRHVFLWQDGAMRDIGRYGWDGAGIPLFVDAGGRVSWWEKGRGWMLRDRETTIPLGFWVSAANARGALAGDTSDHRVVVWEDGVLRDLGHPLGADSVFVQAINESGEILGVDFGGPGADDSRAVLVADGQTRDLATGARDSALSYAWALNDRGQVLGQTASGQIGLWDDGVLHEIERPDQVWTPHRPALDNRGRVALGGATALLWTNGRTRDLGSFGASRVDVVDLTDSGLIVGTVYGKRGWPQAFAWRDGVFTKLPSRGRAATVVGANERGQIIGTVGPVDTTHAVLWTPVAGA